MGSVEGRGQRLGPSTGLPSPPGICVLTGQGWGPCLISQMRVLTSGGLHPGPGWAVPLVWPGLAWAGGWAGGCLVGRLSWASPSLLPQGWGLVTWSLGLGGNRRV